MIRTSTVVTMTLLVAALAWPGRASAEWRFDLTSGKWVNVAPAKDADGQDREEYFKRVLDACQRGDLEAAATTMSQWLDVYRPQGDVQWGLFLLGQIEQDLGDYMKAHEVNMELLDGYAGTPVFAKVLQSEITMAKAFLAGKKRRVARIFIVGATDEAEDMLLKVYQRDPRGPHGRTALLTLADYHFATGDFVSSQAEYEQLAQNFPRDPDAGKFKLMAAQSAMGQFRGTSHEIRPLTESEVKFRQLKDEHPELAAREHVDDVLDAIQQRRAEKDLKTADFYRRTGHDKSAIFYYREVLRNHPNTTYAAEALSRLQAMGYDPAKEPTGPPQVTAAGPQGTLPRVAGAGPSPERSPPASDQPGGAQSGPPRILTAGPAPVIRTSPDATVIDIGLPTEENVPVEPDHGKVGMGQAGDRVPTTQPDDDHES
ncbi:MAG: Outer membrane protein assembly factor BamD [Phycisphaerae bacterium]|nr:Outer membrane protein assembly factor BamD [Phycisphaerae bacterium]